MLTSFESLRSAEFPQLDAGRLAYLDYTGAAIPSASQFRAQQLLLQTSVLGNPHSEHAPSRASTEVIEHTRDRVLRFFDADPGEYVVIFTANASASIKLVAESFPFRRGSRLVLSADNHNSMNGMAEFARRRGATVRTLPLGGDLRLFDPMSTLSSRLPAGPSLLGFPAQSNFSGVRHPLTLVAEAQRLGYRVILDAAAFVPTSPFTLRTVRPDFVALSLYKMFGVPTGVGVLIARRDALAQLQRPWFAGGTVDWASVQHRSHRLRAAGAAFEDGTPNYYGIAAGAAGFDFLERVDMPSLSSRVTRLIASAREDMRHRTHDNGRDVFRVYGPSDGSDQGGTLSVNLLDRLGRIIPYESVELIARDSGLAVRGGCFCNPGASEAAFGFVADDTRRCLRATSRGEFSPRRLSDCLGSDVAVGAIRLSVGLPTLERDLAAGVDILARIAAEIAPAERRAS